jgi:hypothetical protein
MANRRRLDVIEIVGAGKRIDAWSTQKHGYVRIRLAEVTKGIQFWQQPHRIDAGDYNGLHSRNIFSGVWITIRQLLSARLPPEAVL